jgi:hypothetical protein
MPPHEKPVIQSVRNNFFVLFFYLNELSETVRPSPIVEEK